MLNKYYPYKTLDRPLTIYIATDIHLYAEVDGNADHPEATIGNRLFYTAGQKFQNFVDDVKKNKPDLAFITGDMLEYWGMVGTPELFVEKWNQITTKKGLTVGNHDLAVGGAEVANTTMANLLGYGTKPIIAGSKYNDSFYLDNGHNRVKIISFDTNLNASGVHIPMAKQNVIPSVIDWVKVEILNSTTDNILLLSHSSPADDTEWHFELTGQVAFKAMIDYVMIQKPKLKLYNISGHNHRQGIVEYSRLGDGIKCYSISPVVDYVTGKYTIVSISDKNGLKMVEKDLNYPYP